MLCQFTEPAAAVRSPGAAMEREQHRPFCEELRERAHVAFLRRQLEGGRGLQRRCDWPSEQLHFHELARFDDVGLRGNLDVAVGVRHAGDVARALNAGTAAPSTMRTV